VVNGSTLEDKSDSTKLIAERPFLFWSKGPDGFYDLARAGVAGNPCSGRLWVGVRLRRL